MVIESDDGYALPQLTKKSRQLNDRIAQSQSVLEERERKRFATARAKTRRLMRGDSMQKRSEKFFENALDDVSNLRQKIRSVVPTSETTDSTIFHSDAHSSPSSPKHLHPSRPKLGKSARLRPGTGGPRTVRNFFDDDWPDIDPMDSRPPGVRKMLKKREGRLEQLESTIEDFFMADNGRVDLNKLRSRAMRTFSLDMCMAAKAAAGRALPTPQGYGRRKQSDSDDDSSGNESSSSKKEAARPVTKLVSAVTIRRRGLIAQPTPETILQHHNQIMQRRHDRAREIDAMRTRKAIEHVNRQERHRDANRQRELFPKMAAIIAFAKFAATLNNYQMLRVQRRLSNTVYYHGGEQDPKDVELLDKLQRRKSVVPPQNALPLEGAIAARVQRRASSAFTKLRAIRRLSDSATFLSFGASARKYLKLLTLVTMFHIKMMRIVNRRRSADKVRLFLIETIRGYKFSKVMKMFQGKVRMLQTSMRAALSMFQYIREHVLAPMWWCYETKILGEQLGLPQKAVLAVIEGSEAKDHAYRYRHVFDKLKKIRSSVLHEKELRSEAEMSEALNSGVQKRVLCICDTNRISLNRF